MRVTLPEHHPSQKKRANDAMKVSQAIAKMLKQEQVDTLLPTQSTRLSMPVPPRTSVR